MRQIFNSPILKKKRKELRVNQTDAEGLFWAHLRNKQLNDLKFYRQYSVGKYIVDFYCPAKRLVVEVDGGQHNEDKVKAYDDKRSTYLKERGIKIIRFWNNDVFENLDAVVDEILYNL